jgi:hypothetical protein
MADTIEPRIVRTENLHLSMVSELLRQLASRGALVTIRHRGYSLRVQEVTGTPIQVFQRHREFFEALEFWYTDDSGVTDTCEIAVAGILQIIIPSSEDVDLCA